MDTGFFFKEKNKKVIEIELDVIMSNREIFNSQKTPKKQTDKKRNYLFSHILIF